MTQSLCVVAKGFPRVSETFITRELEALESAGLKFSIASLRRPQQDAAKVSHRVTAPVNYLPEYLHDEPLRVVRALADARRRQGFQRAWAAFRADLEKDFSRNRLRRFGQGCVLAAELPEETRHLHAHFIHTPASVARYAAAIRNITFSISSHAKDIWTTPDWDLVKKMRDAQFTCICNEAASERLNALSPEKVPLFWPHLTAPVSDGGRPPRDSGPVRLLTVARAVPKKGLHLLLDAFARLPPEPAWTWTHIGGGPGLERLRSSVQDHPYKDRLRILGSRPNSDVLAALNDHDIFVLTALVADDGDRDGRPNALIEAMSAGLACVATSVGGIAELLRHDAGLVVEPDPNQIAQTLSNLIMAPQKIEGMGLSARIRAASLHDEGLTAFAKLERMLRRASGQ